MHRICKKWSIKLKNKVDITRMLLIAIRRSRYRIKREEQVLWSKTKGQELREMKQVHKRKMPPLFASRKETSKGSAKFKTIAAKQRQRTSVQC